MSFSLDIHVFLVAGLIGCVSAACKEYLLNIRGRCIVTGSAHPNPTPGSDSPSFKAVGNSDDYSHVSPATSTYLDSYFFSDARNKNFMNIQKINYFKRNLT